MIALSTKQKLPKTPSALRTRVVSKPEDLTLFWRRQQNADLDKSGDILLANLEEIRKEACSRGDSH